LEKRRICATGAYIGRVAASAVLHMLRDKHPLPGRWGSPLRPLLRDIGADLDA
jgi:hypothetical protein